MIATLAPVKPKLLTAEDLMNMDSEGVRGELVQGVFCEIMGSGFRHTVIAGRFARHLGNFVEPRGLGLVGGADGGVRLERDPDTVRIPDAMFIPANRLPPYDDIDLYFESVPAIAVEVKSPSDSVAEVNDKARMWRSYGVPLVWAAYPDTRTIDVHRADGTIATLYEDDVLDGGEILPGFAVPVSDIFSL